MDVFHGQRVVRVTFDSGTTGNMIRHTTAKHLGCPIISSAQSVQQADGSSKLQVVGEIRTSFTRDNTDFKFEGLVVEDLDVEVLAGTPFMEANDVAVRPVKRVVLLGNGSAYTYGSQAPPSPPHNLSQSLCSPCPYSFQDFLAWRIRGSTAPRRRTRLFRVCT